MVTYVYTRPVVVKMGKVALSQYYLARYKKDFQTWVNRLEDEDNIVFQIYCMMSIVVYTLPFSKFCESLMSQSTTK